MKQYAPHEFKVMRVRECMMPSESGVIDTAQKAADYWRANIPQAEWFDPTKEALVALALNTRRRALGHNLVTLGSLDACIVTPLAVFRPIIVMAASALILIHNHPSGDPTPSQADIRVTCDLVRAGQLLKIELLDHVIIGENHASLRELGFIS